MLVHSQIFQLKKIDGKLDYSKIHGLNDVKYDVKVLKLTCQ